jgi:cytochrome c biogenesis protein ResB
VDFTLALRRAWQVKDPGSSRPAWFQSDVTLAEDGEPAREQRIVMNQPVAVGPYKVYQANYRALFDPRTGEPIRDGRRQVSLSGLAVARDPGLWFKYAGSFLVAIGIATMFWMKAYFFKPRSRRST